MKKLEHITNEQIQQIRKKTPTGMFSTNKPNQEGFSAEQVRDAYTHALLDPKFSIVELINILIDNLNDSGIITTIETYPTDLTHYLNQTILVKSNNTLYHIDENGNSEIININNEYITFNESKGIIYLKVRNPNNINETLSVFTIEKDGIYYIEGQYVGSANEDKYKTRLATKNDLNEIIDAITINRIGLLKVGEYNEDTGEIEFIYDEDIIDTFDYDEDSGILSLTY